MLDMSFVLLSLFSLSSALVVCFLIDWLPRRMAREEAVFVAELLSHHREFDPDNNVLISAPAATTLTGFGGWLLSKGIHTEKVLAALCTMGAVVWAFYHQANGFMVVLWAIWGCGLVLLAFIDARTKLLPDALTLPLMWLGMLIQILPETRTIGLEFSIIGAIAGYLPLWLFAQAYRLIRGRDGLGMGDLKLLAAMGAWSGPILLPQVLLLAALLAIAVFVIERLFRHQAKDLHEERPFGPWIVVGYFIVLFMAT